MQPGGKEASKLVSNSLQRGGDLSRVTITHCRLGKSAQPTFRELLGDGNMSQFWYSASAPCDSVQGTGEIEMVKISDAAGRLLCLLPANEGVSSGSRYVLLKRLFENLERKSNGHCAIEEVVPENSSTTGVVSVTNQPADWAPGDFVFSSTGLDLAIAKERKVSFKETKEVWSDGGSSDGDSDGELRHLSSPVGRKPNTSSVAPTTPCSPSNTSPESKTLSGVALRTYRKWKKSHLDGDRAAEKHRVALDQSRAQQAFLERLYRSGDDSSGRSPTRHIANENAVKAMRLWTTNRRSEKQLRKFQLPSDNDHVSITSMGFLPASQLRDWKRQRLGTSSATIESGDSMYKGKRHPLYRLSKSMETPDPSDYQGLPLVRAKNIGAPRTRPSPVPFRELRTDGDLPDYSSDSGAEDEPRDGVSIGSIDSPRSVSDIADGDSDSTGTQRTLELDEQDALEFDRGRIGGTSNGKRKSRSRFICLSDEESL